MTHAVPHQMGSDPKAKTKRREKTGICKDLIPRNTAEAR